MTVAEHHERAIAALAARARTRGAIGLVVVGSVARATSRPESDLDAYEVVDDARFDVALQHGSISWVETEGCDWVGGYCDLKLSSPALLRAAAERGDDPVRASFEGARVVFDDRGDLSALVAAAGESTPARFAGLAASFAAQLVLYGGYFLPQALELDNTLLARSAAIHAATAAGRLVLARASVLYRGPKYLSEQLVALPSYSQGLNDAIVQLAENPSLQALRTVRELVSVTGSLPESIEDDVLSRFIIENEMSWFTGVPPAEAR